jgi:ActR/RegA family two-component response regulator
MLKAVICENDPDVQKIIALSLKTYGFECITPLSLEEGLQAINLDDVHIVVVDENFADENPKNNRIINEILSFPMYIRREMMFILTGKSLPTMNRLYAFAKGADLVINTQDLSNFNTIFKRAYAEYQKTYRQFKELLTR